MFTAVCATALPVWSVYMTDWSAMAWEPCILKHGARFDDPWENAGKVVRRRSKACVLWDESGEHRFSKITDAIIYMGMAAQSRNAARYFTREAKRRGLQCMIVDDGEGLF
jgi:hypothetical protein